MNEYSAEVWKSANNILQTFENAAGAQDDIEAVKAQLLTLLDAEDSSGSKPGVEDFEYALQTALMSRLENPSKEEHASEVIRMLDVTAAVVTDIFRRAARQGAPSTETDRCKTWWTMFFTIAEDVSRLIPVTYVDKLAENWEASLVTLRSAYLQLASARLAEVDAKQAEQEQKKDEEDGESKEQETKSSESKEKDNSKEAAAKEAKRIEERKKMINHLSVSPNGQLYLTLTSLLKQLASRLIGTTQAATRARIVLLLEKLLAMDHKAIANNQKTRTLDFVSSEDLDSAEDVVKIFTKGIEGQKEDASKVATQKESNESNKIEIDGALYRSFWNLQEYLQYPERLLLDEGRKTDSDTFTWKKFHECVSKLLKFFKQHPVQDARRQPWVEPEVMPLRHAPRADSFRVQMDDAGFRQQFLTQVLIAFSALEQDASSKAGLHVGPISKLGDASKKEYRSLKSSCEGALEQVRPGFVKLLNCALEREAHWLQWKGHGCREFERESQEMLNAKATPGDELLQNPSKDAPAKPKIAGWLTGMLKTLRDPQWSVASIATDESPEKAAAQMQIIKASKMCEANLDRLMEDEKPENGIEEEYKAKKNKVFMWQSRRFFCQQYLPIFAAKENHNKSDFLDFVKVVRAPPQPPPGTAAMAAAQANNATAEKSPAPEGGDGEEIADAGADEEEEPGPGESPPADNEVAPEAEADKGNAETEKTTQQAVPGEEPALTKTVETNGGEIAPPTETQPTSTESTGKREASAEAADESSPSAKKARHS